MNLGKSCFSVEDSRTMEELGQTTRSTWRTVQFLGKRGMELVSFLYEAFHQQFREPSALQGRPAGISPQPPRIWAQTFPSEKVNCRVYACVVCMSVCMYILNMP